MTTPTHFERAFKNTKPGDATRQALGLELSCQNPVALLPRDDFITLLRTSIACHNFIRAGQRTTSHMEMAAGLAVLEGKPNPFPNALLPSARFDWSGSLGILDPMTACVYQRMHAELSMLEPLAMPDMQQDDSSPYP